MPTVGDLQLEPGKKGDPRSGFRSTFSHSTEVAEPDYYKVKLEVDNILAEMTATTRVGFHQYTFMNPPANAGGSDSANSHIILDLMHGIYNYDEKNVWTFVRVENDHTVVGFRQTNGWARTRTVYFAMEFSKPFTSYGYKDFDPSPYRGFWRKFDVTKNFPEMAGKQLRAYFDFKTVADEKIKIKFAISPVSTDGAMANMKYEAPNWDFDWVRRKGQIEWDRELSKVAVTADNRDDMVNFYTAMYHALLSPTVYMDVDGRYKGIDQNVHRVVQKPDREGGRSRISTNWPPADAGGSDNYTTFSLWDTYRALHPLLNIIQPTRNRNMIRSIRFND
jgi:putative alpha-1,2-mannosidase